MKRWWPREVLRFVDAWACREGTPEDDEDERERARTASEPCGENRGGGGSCDRRGEEGGGVFSVRVGDGHGASSADPKDNIVSHDNEMRGPGNNDASHDWVELDLYPHADEEIGRKGR